MVWCYCLKSAENAEMDSKIRCDGPCEQFMHIDCAKITKQLLQAYNECNEMHFYCKLCNKHSLIAIGETMNAFSKEINSLSLALKPLSTVDFKALTASFITNKTINQNIPMATHPNVTFRGTPKRRRIENNQNKPIELIGTKESDILETVSPSPPTIRKGMVISHLASSTSVNTVVKYITDNKPELKADDIKCTILIPMNKDPKEPKHINFRVSVPEETFTTVFNPEFWPRGVRLREYIYRQRP